MSVPNIVRASLGALGQFSIGQQTPVNPSGGRRPAGHGERRRTPVRPIWDRQRELDARKAIPEEIRGPLPQTPTLRPPLIVPRPDAGKGLEAQIIPLPWIMPDGRRVTPVYRNIATLNITEQGDVSAAVHFESDTLDAHADVRIAGEVRIKLDDDAGRAEGFVLVSAALRSASTDQLLALGVHFGIDDDEEAIALLLDDDEE